MSWLYLFLAIIFELLGTSLLKLSNGFSVLLPSLGTIISYALCFYVLSLSLKTLDIGIAYAIWAALGLALVAVIGIVFFHESINLVKIISLLFIIIGVVGLNLSSKLH